MTTPIWISHRGLSQEHDENSLTAFAIACDAGFSWLETDLHSTRDNHIVLSHDPTLDTASPYSGNIGELTRAELEKVHLPKGGNYLFLDEFMMKFEKQHWVFDIKPATAAQTMNIISKILKNKISLLNKITFLFWNKKIEENFLNDFPDATCFAMETACYRAGIATLCGLPMLGNIQPDITYAISPKILGVSVMNKKIIHTFHQQGARVIGYLPATPDEAQLCLDAGVDYILSNDLPIS